MMNSPNFSGGSTVGVPPPIKLYSECDPRLAPCKAGPLCATKKDSCQRPQENHPGPPYSYRMKITIMTFLLTKGGDVNVNAHGQTPPYSTFRMAIKAPGVLPRYPGSSCVSCLLSVFLAVCVYGLCHRRSTWPAHPCAEPVPSPGQ